MNKIKQKWKIFCLLLYKSYLVRKRHWKVAIFVQILAPILLFLLVQAIRDSEAKPPIHVENNTYYDVQRLDDLLTTVSKDIDIYYVPKNQFTGKIMEVTRHCLKLPFEKIIGFETESSALNAYSLDQNSDTSNNVVMVLFKSDVSSKQFRYTIKTQRSMPSELYFNMGVGEILYPYLFVVDTPFVQIQHCLDTAFIAESVDNPLFKEDPYFKYELSVQQMPSPPHIEMDIGDLAIRQFFCTIASIAFLIPLLCEANFAANEKFIGVNVLMAMNGVCSCKNLLSWLISGLLFSIFYTVPVALLLKISFSSNVHPFIYYSNGFLFWLILFFHVAHLLAFGMHIAAYFSRPLFMISGILVAYFCSTLILKYTAWTNFYKITPFFGIIFPNILLFRALEEVNIYEGQLMGIHWNNIFLTGDTSYTAAGSVGMMLIFSILGAIVHFMLTVYMYAVKPGKYGVRKHPLYFLESFRRNRVSTAVHVGKIEYDNLEGQPFESPPVAILPGIQIRDLKKSYFTNFFSKTASVEALKGISIDFYKSHITALLGHNGAGKTTMMSILTGMISPTNGTVLINGKNVNKDLDIIMTDLGLCPQDDILFPDLNVFEQLLFFGMLKNNFKTKKQITEDVMSLLKKLNLIEKRNVLPVQLSGGQKRRVCLGMALVGDAKTLILDEPTSGMDPESRRDTWDIILGMRTQKTIIISTHNMEEADILGDRIAIIHSGTLRCYGTSMFLKKFYGRGNMEVTLSTEPSCNPEEIRKTLNPRGELINNDGGRLVLSIPYSEDLPDALDNVENHKKDLGVTGMSVSLITLEQVFLKVTKDVEDTVDLHEPLLDSMHKIKGPKLVLQQMSALLNKKMVYTTKNLGILLIKMLLPMIGVILMMNFNLPDNSQTIIPLQLSLYRYPETYYSTKNNIFATQYTAVTKEQGGIANDAGTRTTLNNVLLNIGVEEKTRYMNSIIAAAEFNDTSKVLRATALYSGTATFALPISFNLLTNTLLKSLTGSDEFEIQLSTQSLPLVHMARSAEEENFIAYGRVFIFISFIFPMSALFVIHALRESMSGIKHLQLMTGTTCNTYWGMMFLFDFLVFFFASCFIISGIAVMDCIKQLNLYKSAELMIILLLLLLFAINVLPVVYILSFWRKSMSTVISIMSQIPLFLVIVELILKLLINLIHKKKLAKVLRTLQKTFFYLIPHVSFFNGNVAFATTAAQNARCRNLPNHLALISCTIGDSCCDLECSNGTCKKSFPYFNKFKEDPSLEECVVSLICTSILYFTILFVMEYKVVQKIFMKMKKNKSKMVIENSDEQVKVEKHEVAVELSKLRSQNNRTKFLKQNSENGVDGNFATHERENSLFLVYELCKRYKNMVAVREISFKVKQRECFGLLGINGAGKSTTFRMLTGEEMPNNGMLFLKGKDIRTQRREYLSQMGYCPQNSALIDSLNTRDHLKLFALLRGIPKTQVTSEVNKWIDKLNLNVCATQPSGTYSGGNKRRLNIAIAMIGNPSLVLLDEPTTGVDPAARRSLWDVIASCQSGGQSIILTSHSMEECEALCNRLVIMVKGELVCIGACQQLKQKFGAGFDIQIKLRTGQGEGAITDLKNEVESRLPCELRDENAGLLIYHVTNDRLTWKAMYGAMNVIKENHSCVEDFTIISATLEQLFLQFARAAKLPNLQNENQHEQIV